MPTYEYQCKFCGVFWEEFLSIKNIDIPLGKECRCCSAQNTIFRLCNSPPICDPVRLGILKPPSDVREVLRKIKNNNKYHSNVRDR